MPAPSRLQVLIVGPRPPAVGGMVSAISRQLESPLARHADLFVMPDNPPWLRGLGSPGALVRHLSLLVLLVVRLVVGRIDVLHRHTCSFFSFDRSALDLLVARLLRKRVVLHLHGGRMVEFYRARTRLGRAFVRCALRCAHTVVVLHQDQRRWLDTLGVRNVAVVPNAVSLPNLTHRPPPSAPCRLLYVGELSVAKGLPELLCALADLKLTTTTPFLLQLAGPLSSELTMQTLYAQLCRLEIASNVEWLGALEQDALAACYRTADLLVLPSRAEAMPMCVLEAMSYGLPVVATNVGALPELLAGGCGVCVDPGDVRSLTAALRAWIDDSGARRTAGANCRRRVESQYNDALLARRLKEVYAALVAPRGTRQRTARTGRSMWVGLPNAEAPEVATGQLV